MSEHHPAEMDFGDVLPEQTSDDIDHDPGDDADDLRRFLDEVPPHHGD